MKIKPNLPYRAIFEKGFILKESQDFNIIGGVDVIINNTLPDNVNLKGAWCGVDSPPPPSLLEKMQKKITGQQEVIIKRNVNSMYKNGILYITHEQDNNADLYDDIVHEICHSVEEMHQDSIYGDDLLEDEFVRKRRFVLDILAADGYNCSSIDAGETRYTAKIDNFFHEEVGYKKLGNLTRNIFVTPYAITSIREYWATAFEKFWIKPDLRPFIKKSSPVLYQKIINVKKMHNI